MCVQIPYMRGCCRNTNPMGRDIPGCVRHQQTFPTESRSKACISPEGYTQSNHGQRPWSCGTLSNNSLKGCTSCVEEVLPSRQKGAGVYAIRRRCRRLLIVQPYGLLLVSSEDNRKRPDNRHLSAIRPLLWTWRDSNPRPHG